MPPVLWASLLAPRCEIFHTMGYLTLFLSLSGVVFFLWAFHKCGIKGQPTRDSMLGKENVWELYIPHSYPPLPRVWVLFSFSFCHSKWFLITGVGGSSGQRGAVYWSGKEGAFINLFSPLSFALLWFGFAFTSLFFCFAVSFSQKSSFSYNDFVSLRLV